MSVRKLTGIENNPHEQTELQSERKKALDVASADFRSQSDVAKAEEVEESNGEEEVVE